MPHDSFFHEDNDYQYTSDERHFYPQYPFPTPEQPTYKHTSHRTKPTESRNIMGGIKGRGSSKQHRKERERVLSHTPTDTLVRRLIKREDEIRESKKLLHTALTRLEASVQLANKAEEERRLLETTQTLEGLKLTQSMMDAQMEVAKAKQDAGMYKFQLDHAQREIRRAQEMVRRIEDERDDAEHAATKARALARKFKDEKMFLSAREEGRRQGFAEGVKQGRVLALSGDDGSLQRKYLLDRLHTTPVGSGEAFIEEYTENEGEQTDTVGHEPPPAHHRRYDYPPDMPRSMHTSNRSSEARHHRHESHDRTPRGRSSVPQGLPSQHTPRSQPQQNVPSGTSPPLNDVARQEIEAANQKAEEAMRREAEQREVIRQWEQRDAERERQAELTKVKQRETELEKEREAMRVREREREVAVQREMEAIRERERERERGLEKEREQHREREKELEKEREQERERVRELEREREASSNSSQRTSTRSIRAGAPLPYFPMPPPPVQIVVQPPPPTASTSASTSAPAPAPPAPAVPFPTNPQPQQVQPQQIQPQPPPRGHRRQPSTPDTARSPSSTTTGMSALDIITFPTASRPGEERERNRDQLSVIPEDPSIRSQSRASDVAPSPTWLTNPPVDYTARRDINQWRHNTNYPPDSAATSPLTPTSGDFLSPSFRPRGRSPERTTPHNLRRTSSRSTFEVNIKIEPPSRSPSISGLHNADSAGFLSPNHTPVPLAPEVNEAPVIPTYPPPVSGLRNFPPPGFVPQSFTSPPDRTNSSGPGRNGAVSAIYAKPGPPVTAPQNGSWRPPVPKSGSIYSDAPPRSGSIYADAPPKSGSIYSEAPPPSRALQSGARDRTNQTPRQIYAPTPPAFYSDMPPPRTQSSSTRDSTAQTPRQIYAPTPPSLSHSTLRGPVIPPVPPAPVLTGPTTTHRTPPHRGINPRPGATPGPLHQTLPGTVTPRSGFANIYANPDDDDDANDLSPQTRRNTEVNSTLGALPIPPPSFRRY